MSENRPLHIFLCHASADKPAVRLLYKRLKEDGLQPWLDDENLLPGQNWQVEIPKAVHNADVVLVCLSCQSVNKEGYVQKEIKFALDYSDEKPEGTIFVIPARLENCPVPGRLSVYHWVDLFEPGGYERLLLALKVRADQIGVLPPHKKGIFTLPHPAPKVEKPAKVDGKPSELPNPDKLQEQEPAEEQPPSEGISPPLAKKIPPKLDPTNPAVFRPIPPYLRYRESIDRKNNSFPKESLSELRPILHPDQPDKKYSKWNPYSILAVILILVMVTFLVGLLSLKPLVKLLQHTPTPSATVISMQTPTRSFTSTINVPNTPTLTLTPESRLTPALTITPSRPPIGISTPLGPFKMQAEANALGGFVGQAPFNFSIVGAGRISQVNFLCSSDTNPTLCDFSWSVYKCPISGISGGGSADNCYSPVTLLSTRKSPNLDYSFNENGNYRLDFSVCYNGPLSTIDRCGFFSVVVWVGNYKY